MNDKKALVTNTAATQHRVINTAATQHRLKITQANNDTTFTASLEVNRLQPDFLPAPETPTTQWESIIHQDEKNKFINIISVQKQQTVYLGNISTVTLG